MLLTECLTERPWTAEMIVVRVLLDARPLDGKHTLL